MNENRKGLPFQTFVEESVEAPATHLVLDKEFVYKLPNTPTPTVKNLTRFKVNGGVITNFIDGQPGQQISILGDGVTVVEHNAKIERAYGSSGVLKQNTVHRFTYMDGVWKEDAEEAVSVNGGPSRPQIEFIAGAGVTINVVDDPVNNKVQITISSP